MRIELGSRVKTEQGEGHLLDRSISVSSGKNDTWVNPGRSKESPVYSVQLFDGTFSTVTDLSSISPNSIDDGIQYGLRSFLRGDS